MIYSYAGLRLRALAFLVDYIIISIYIILLTALFSLLRLLPVSFLPQKLFMTPLSGQITILFIVTLPVILYFALLESSGRQQTFGKFKLDLKVTNDAGARLSLIRSFIRSIIKFLPWELAHTCLWRIEGWPFEPKEPSPLIWGGLVLVWVFVGIYIISMLLSKTKQTFYDRLAGSLVIKTRVIEN